MKRNIFKVKSVLSTIVAITITLAVLIAVCLLFDSINEWLWLSLIIAIILAIAILVFVYFKPFKYIKTRSYGFLDIYILICAISFQLLAVCALPEFNFLFRKLDNHIIFIVLSSIGIIFGLFFTFRMFYAKSRSCNTNKTLLSNLYENDLPNSNELFIVDEPANYDLLKNDFLIKRIKNSITINKGDEKNIILISGKWGSGKSTFLKCALKDLRVNKDYIIHEGFSAWGYEDSRSVFVALLSEIYKSLGIGATDNTIKRIIEQYADVYLKDKNLNFPFNLIHFGSNEESVVEVINDYLIQNEKRLIFVIDNLDRTSTEMQKLIFDIIADALKLKNVTFVCVCDEALLYRSEADDMSADTFFEKIINCKIDVPNPSKSKIYHIGAKCLENYFKKYNPGLSIGKLSNNEKSLLESAFYSLNNLRELIIVLNKVINFLSINQKYLNIIDLIGIETIRLISPGLFLHILHNIQLFVFIHSEHIEGYNYLLQDEKEKRRKENSSQYFEVGKKYHAFKNLINDLFPHSLDLYGPTSFGRDYVKQSLRDRRIYCGKFTSYYLSDSNYEYIKINNTIDNINTIDNEKSFYEQYNTLLACFAKEDISDVLNVVENNLPDDKTKKLWLAKYLKDKFSSFGTQSGFVSLSARDRAANIISILMNEINKDYAINYINSFADEYRHFTLLTRISYFNEVNIKYDGRESELKDAYSKTISNISKSILTHKLDIYSPNFYERGVTWSLKKNVDADEFQTYIIDILNENNIFCFLNDCISTSVKFGEAPIHSIHLNKSTFDNIIDFQKLCEIVDSAKPSRDCDITIKRLFDAIKNKEENDDNYNDDGIDFDDYPDFINHYW